MSKLLRESGYFHLQTTKPDTVIQHYTSPVQPSVAAHTWSSRLLFLTLLLSLLTPVVNLTSVPLLLLLHYIALQVGVALSSSPLGLAAYIIEKVWCHLLLLTIGGSSYYYY